VHPQARLIVVTGFYIPTATPPAGETDGPLGALFLARALTPLGIQVAIATDGFCAAAIGAGLHACGLEFRVGVIHLTQATTATDMSPDECWRAMEAQNGSMIPPTHLLAIERVGPSHADDRCYTMRGRDITENMHPAHRLFEFAQQIGDIATIGIGDGGNEIGMGKIPREVIARNIPNGDRVACRVPTDHLIVCGVSNWGAYGLAAGVAHLKGKTPDPFLFNTQHERQVLEAMVEAGPLVDGVTGRKEATVDGLSWEQYAAVLANVGRCIQSNNSAMAD
jgi:hypothetical protein